ncbi:MAG TPA: hypothetical protein PK760_05895, partial [Flavobacteriales bacterium]|nr:hypothetical protein [Flavobacteriales bacterium]
MGAKVEVTSRPYRHAVNLLCVMLAMTAQGQSTWRLAYGGHDNDEARVVRVVSPDSFLVAGSTGSFGSGASDIYLVLVDSSGDVLWSRTIGSSGVDVANDLLVLPDGGCLIVGSTTSQGAGGYDGYVVRTDPEGGVLWERTYGGADWDFLNDIKVLDATHYLLTGTTYSAGLTNGSAWVFAIDDNGVGYWPTPLLIGNGTDGLASIPTSDGGFATTGSVEVPGEESDAFVAKYDVAHSAEWFEPFGGDSMDVGRDIIRTSDGGYSVVGATRSYSTWVEAYHLKVDAAGSEVWHQHWGQINDQEAYEHFVSVGGEYVSIGYTRTTGGGGADMFLLRSAVDGGYVFGTTFGGSEDEGGYGIAELVDGFICVGTTMSYGAGG